MREIDDENIDRIAGALKHVPRAGKLNDPLGAPRDSKRTPVLVDLDAFFRPMTEMGEITKEDVRDALPLNAAQARRAAILHQLFKSAVVLTSENAKPEDQLVLRVWSEAAAMYATVGAARGFRPESPDWLTFYTEDLHKIIAARYPPTVGSRVLLTLDSRLVAWSDTAKGEIRLSAITREYLLRINIVLANLTELVVEEDRALDEGDSVEFFDYVLKYMLRLHRDLAPGALPTARPRTADSFQFAQRITQVQTEFLMLHEFGHLVHADKSGLSRNAIESLADDFAFEVIQQSETQPWMWFLAIRWLFELLAFDRVLAECLAYEGGDWGRDIDWLQLDLRSRRRIAELLEDERFSDKIGSAYEMVGSIFLLDLKSVLFDLGPESLQVKVREIKRSEAMPTAEWINDRMSQISSRVFSSGPLSARRIFELWTPAS